MSVETARRDIQRYVRAEPVEMVCAAFGTPEHVGNQTAVVRGAPELSDSEMRATAERYGLETAFILPSPLPSCDFRLRFFVPDHEMAMCVHGTIEALAALVADVPGLPPSLRVETLSGVITVGWHFEGDFLKVGVSQDAPTFADVDASPERIASLLSISPRDIDTALPIQSISTSRPKLIVPVRDAMVLDRVAPKYDLLWHACEEWGVTGMYPVTFTARTRGRSADVRQFPVHAGFPEDPATGVAAAALAGYVVRHGRGHFVDGTHHFVIGQGDAMGCPCVIEVDAVVSSGVVTHTIVSGISRVIDGNAHRSHRSPPLL